MNRTYNKLSFLSLSAALFLMGCGSTALVSTPVENIDAVPLKISELSEAEKKHWGHLDLIADTIPGMSVDKAYDEIIKNKKGKTVVVAVLDSGMDLEHEDLKNVLWTNTDEIPNNGKDDDGNGYVDDIHGYNFLGDSYNEQLEYVRMLRLNIGDASERAEARLLLDKEYPEAVQNKQQYEQIFQVVKGADELVRNELGKETYTKEDLLSIELKTAQMEQSVAVLTQMFTYGESIPKVLEELKEGITYFTEQANYNLNKDFNGRTPVGDDPYDITDVPYGNGNPKNMVDTESHGTHVAGIIAATRNNGIGVDGVANNVEIMSVRAVPNGDEYDKDIALGIRYAVDNGASIINCSFGKSFSPKAEWVYDAIKYAASKDVLIVHAAGNDGEDLEIPENRNYPNDDMGQSQEFVDNMITVGALSSSYGSEMVASFSNYGNHRVDVFAPGAEIYSTMPNGEYEFQGGTSMAAPAVAGVAALVRSYHPELSASQVKNIIMQSGLRTKRSVIVAGDETKTATFDKISKSGKMVNAYNALILANNISKGTMTLESNSK
ncbi:Subtilisin [Allomuricauda ruestringensis DSM 13258]|uniref:Subtilisin n=1 Tax=Allomuricauda ruestringensis (strain DSM 13258 / CIP 107369 / LMG 19739 / B1) TaxID=886377 RepID=G2PP91_ALLRU|nr:S8 family peptidase [Allomuricauda ruestringensis]AEM70343.1 Subtilisin [Allomuricauda ruestringensis DSM 13258]